MLKALFGLAPVTHRGRHYAVEGVDSFPKPVQRPHPPIHVAAARPRLLAIAAREADIVGLQSVNGKRCRHRRSKEPVRACGCATTRTNTPGSRRPIRRARAEHTATVVITDHPPATADRIALERGWSGVTAQQVMEMPSIFVGSRQHVIELFHERRATYGISYFVVPDRALATVAPAVADLVTHPTG